MTRRTKPIWILMFIAAVIIALFALRADAQEAGAVNAALTYGTRVRHVTEASARVPWDWTLGTLLVANAAGDTVPAEQGYYAAGQRMPDGAVASQNCWWFGLPSYALSNDLLAPAIDIYALIAYPNGDLLTVARARHEPNALLLIDLPAENRPGGGGAWHGSEAIRVPRLAFDGWLVTADYVKGTK